MISSVSKYRLSAASLVTALPAAYLAYILVMAFLQKPGFNEMKGFFQIISGLTLLMVTLVVLMPVGILIFGQKSDATPKKKAEPKEKTDKDDGEDLSVDDQTESKSKAKPASKDDGEDISVDEDDDLFEDEGFAEDDADDLADDDFADDDFDDFDDKPKKRK